MSMRWLRTALLPLALAGFAGCGSEEDSIALVPVKGTITINNKPLAGATVAFLPDAGNKVSTPGNDVTGPEGTYLIRFKNRSGLSPGKYTVQVTPPLTLSGGPKIPDAFKDDPYQAQLASGIGIPGSAAENKRAAEVTKREWIADVDAKNGVFDYDVKATSSAASAKK